LTGKCPAITRGGEPCRGLVRPGNDYCPAHDPARSEDRRRAASKAGRAKPTKELASIKGRLSSLADDVLEGKVERGDGAVVSQILNVYLRAVAVEMKVKEQQELEERLEQLESALERKREGGGQWGSRIG
jgi:hypothetical protein